MIKLVRVERVWYVFVDWFDDDSTIMYSHKDKNKAEEYIEIAKNNMKKPIRYQKGYIEKFKGR